MLGLSIFRVAPEPSMMIASAVAVLLAVLLQGQSLTAVLNSLYSGGNVRTGLESIDSLLGRGGILSMMWTLSLSLSPGAGWDSGAWPLSACVDSCHCWSYPAGLDLGCQHYFCLFYRQHDYGRGLYVDSPERSVIQRCL